MLPPQPITWSLFNVQELKGSNLYMDNSSFLNLKTHTLSNTKLHFTIKPYSFTDLIIHRDLIIYRESTQLINDVGYWIRSDPFIKDGSDLNI